MFYNNAFYAKKRQFLIKTKEEVWDNWINEGNLIVIENDQIPVSMAHAGFYPNEKMIWIEGIRIDPNFQRQTF